MGPKLVSVSTCTEDKKVKAVLVICYDRPENLELWADAWSRMNTADCKLIFIITGDIPKKEYPDYIEVIYTDNAGYSTGAVKRFIDFRDDYDELIWMPDDFLPLRADLFQLFSGADVVSTFWSVDIHPHIRTGGILMTKQVAKSLRFPPNILQNVKETEYDVEYGEYCFYDQVVKLGHSIKMLDGTVPPNSPQWNHSEHRYIADLNLVGEGSKAVGYEYDTYKQPYACPF